MNLRLYYNYKRQVNLSTFFVIYAYVISSRLFQYRIIFLKQVVVQEADSSSSASCNVKAGYLPYSPYQHTR